MKLKSIITEENFFYAFLVLLVAVAAVLILYFDNKQRKEFYALIDNPTFRGEVVDMASVKNSFGSFGLLDWFTPMEYTEYRLHIVGQYQDGDGMIQVDRVFTVSDELYKQFNIGDEIAYIP